MKTLKKALRIIFSAAAAVSCMAVSFVPSYAQSQSVTYNGSVHKFFSTSDDFFADEGMNQMLPGDTYSGSARLKNTGPRTIRMYFRTRPETEYSDTQSKNMLKDFDLKITVTKKGKKQTVYSGKWIGDSKNVAIGTYKPGETAKFRFAVSLPKSHTNKFNMQKTRVYWIFSCMELSPPKTVNPTPVPVPEPVRTVIHSVKTGDETDLALMASVMLLAAGVIAVIVVKRKGGKATKGLKMFVAVAVCSTALSGGAKTFKSTGAFFSDGDTKKNEFAVGDNNSQIVETFTSPGDIHPGGSYQKVVQVQNGSSVTAYARAFIEFSNSDMGDFASLALNTNDWTPKQADGYYYYKYPLKKGETTQPLLNSVTLNNWIRDHPEFNVKDFSIICYEETTQAFNSKASNGTDRYTMYSSAQEAFNATVGKTKNALE